MNSAACMKSICVKTVYMGKWIHFSQSSFYLEFIASQISEHKFILLYGTLHFEAI
jgi:hypothetical protein